MSNAENIAGDFLSLLGLIKHEYFKPAEQITRNRLSPAQFHAINILCHKVSLPMSELAAELKISKQQLTPLVARLIEYNLVVRKPDESDRRIIRIEITEEGRNIFKALFVEIRRNFTEKLSSVPEDELDELAHMLTRMQEILKPKNSPRGSEEWKN